MRMEINSLAKSLLRYSVVFLALGGVATLTFGQQFMPTVDIPSQTEKAEEANEAEEADSAFSDAIERAIPDTGNKTIDETMETFSDAVGDMAESLIRHLPQIFLSFIGLIFTAIAASAVQRIVKRILDQINFRRSLRDLFAQLVYTAVWFIGVLIACGILFPGFGIGELVATAGLLTIAIGFAFQDIFENFFAGILILWRFPFEVGDYIEIESENIEGCVEDILIRMTLIRLTTGELVTVPNATVYKSPIRILTNQKTRRITFTCGVAYGEDVGEAREVIRKAVSGCETVNKDKPIQIFLTEFGASSMDFEVTWWSGAKPVEKRASRNEVIEAVKRALDGAGIEIPYPYRVLTFTKNEPLIYEKMIEAGRAEAGRAEAGDRKSEDQ
ncbi:MAG: mechanosensitive ion channel family protein [Puniceicoccales bacterium]